jgi:hypothetical protein
MLDDDWIDHVLNEAIEGSWHMYFLEVAVSGVVYLENNNMVFLLVDKHSILQKYQILQAHLSDLIDLVCILEHGSSKASD